MPADQIYPRFAELGLVEALAKCIAGGYPVALARSSTHHSGIWYRDYIENLVQRDVRDLARITSLDALPRLLALAAGQTARLIIISNLASPFQLIIKKTKLLDRSNSMWS